MEANATAKTQDWHAGMGHSQSPRKPGRPESPKARARKPAHMPHCSPFASHSPHRNHSTTKSKIHCDRFKRTVNSAAFLRRSDCDLLHCQIQCGDTVGGLDGQNEVGRQMRPQKRRLRMREWGSLPSNAVKNRRTESPRIIPL